MAYLVDLDEPCSTPGCHARATVEVRNRANAVMRRCCRKHGEQLVADLNDHDQ